jgi:hypothetical protein
MLFEIKHLDIKALANIILNDRGGVIMVRISDSVVKAEIRETTVVDVSKELYRTVQSFVNSSSKPIYTWNVGVRIGNKVVFVKPSKWVLEVDLNPEVMPHENYVALPIRLVSLIGNCEIDIGFKYARYADYVQPDVKTEIRIIDRDGKTRHVVDFDVINYEWSLELRATALYNKDVIYSYPIRLINIVSRINDYVNLLAYYTTIKASISEKTK